MSEIDLNKSKTKKQSTNPLQDIHPSKRAHKIDNSQNSLRHEIIFKTYTLEDSGPIIIKSNSRQSTAGYLCKDIANNVLYSVLFSGLKQTDPV